MWWKVITSEMKFTWRLISALLYEFLSVFASSKTESRKIKQSRYLGRHLLRKNPVLGDLFFSSAFRILDEWRRSALLIILLNIFKVGFIRPQGRACAVIFRRFRSRDRAMTVFMEQLMLEAEALPEGSEGVHETVLSVIPINELVGK